MSVRWITTGRKNQLNNQIIAKREEKKEQQIAILEKKNVLFECSMFIYDQCFR